MTAEFAVAMPAVLLVLATALGGIQLAGLQLRLQDAAADAARSLGRGESVSAAGQQARLQVPGSELVEHARDDLVCAQLSASPTGPIGLTGMRIEATACALAGGR